MKVKNAAPVDVLRKFDIFSGCDDRLLKKLSNLGTPIRIEAGVRSPARGNRAASSTSSPKARPRFVTRDTPSQRFAVVTSSARCR